MNTEDELILLLKNTSCLMNNLPGFVFIKDMALNFVECNNEFQKLLKISKKNIIGQTDYDFPWAHYADLYRQRDQEAIKERSTSQLFSVSHDSTLANFTESPWLDHGAVRP